MSSLAPEGPQSAQSLKAYSRGPENLDLLFQVCLIRAEVELCRTGKESSPPGIGLDTHVKDPIMCKLIYTIKYNLCKF